MMDWKCAKCRNPISTGGRCLTCHPIMATVQAGEIVNPVNPSHYNGDSCMIAIEEVTKDLNGPEGFCTGNVIKYLWRWKKKNGVEDLKKARWYLDRLISYLGG